MRWLPAILVLWNALVPQADLWELYYSSVKRLRKKHETGPPTKTQTLRKSRRVCHPEKRNLLLRVDVLEWYHPSVIRRQEEKSRMDVPPATLNGKPNLNSPTPCINCIAWVQNVLQDCYNQAYSGQQ